MQSENIARKGVKKLTVGEGFNFDRGTFSVSFSVTKNFNKGSSEG